MAFGDSNDIKINVTVNTTDAKKAAKEIGDAFKAISKDIGADFKTIANISKDFANVRIAQIKAESAEEIQRSKERTEKKLAAIKADVEKFTQAETTKRETAKATSDAIAQVVQKLSAIYKEAEASKREEARQTAKVETEKLQQVANIAKETQNTRRVQIKAANALAIQAVKEETNQVKVGSQERIKIRLLEADQFKINLKNNLQIFKVSQATIRSENKITAEQLKLDAAKVRQETVKLQKGLSDAGGAGKAFDALRSAFLGASVGIGPLTVGVGTLASTLGPGGLLVGAIGVATGAIAAFGTAAFKTLGGLAEGANRVQGLTTAFSTLQQSLARDPVQSIQRLREATQGLISDTELYQKANQAVLLGVPAKLFDESAEAAVKLGRAMGIDARLALESLSIGLGRQSRLYLDNLGIIVSATEAYRKYAQELKISANDLSDAQKRQAFFNETSVQLRDGLARLPQIQDDVGVAYTKLSTLTQNASDAFLSSFNSSTELAGGIGVLRDGLAKDLIPALERLGTIAGSVFTALLQAASSTLPPVINFIKEFAENLDIVFFKSSKTRTLQLSSDIANIKKQLEGLAVTNERLQGAGTRLEVQQRERANALRDELLQKETELNNLLEQQRLERSKPINIPLRVENEEVLSNISETESAIAGLKKKVEEDLGVIRLPGIDINQVKQFEPELDAIFKSIETGALKGEAAGLAVEAAVKKISVALGEANKKATEVDIARVRKGLEAKPDDSNLKLELAGLEQRLKLQTENVAADEQQRLQLIKLAQERQKAVKKEIQDAKAAGKQSSDILKQRQNEIEKFLRAVNKKTESAIPPEIQKRISEIFKGAVPGTVEFIEKMRQLAEEFRNAGGDLNALASEVDKADESFQRLAQQGVPINIIPDSQELRESAAEYNDYLAGIQEGVLNLRDLINGVEFDPATGKKKGGGFFGFDLSDSIPKDLQTQLQGAVGAETFAGVEAALAKAIIDGLKLAIDLAFREFTRDDAPEIGTQIGTVLGGEIGGIVGRLVGEYIARNTQDLASTRERKKIDQYFGELFDGGRLGIVIQGQVRTAVSNGLLVIGETIEQAKPQLQKLSDIVFEGFTPFAGNVQFGGEGFFNYFNTLSAGVQESFNGIGLAIGKLQGISTEQARLIGVALANNIGGNLQNLQVLVQATGASLVELSDAIVEAFLNAEISISEAYNSLAKLQNIFEKGIPGAIGAYSEAIDNFATSIRDNQPGRYAVDAFRDVASEADEAGLSFEQTVQKLGESIGLSADQIVLLFEVLRANGIKILEDLENASNTRVVSILGGLDKIRQGYVTTAEQVAKLPVLPEPEVTKPSGVRRKSAAQIAEEERAALIKRQVEEARSLTAASKEYQAIVEKIAKGILTQEAGGRQLLKLQQEILAKVKQRDELEKKINGELDKGAGANAKLIAEYEKKLKKIEDRLAQINEEVETSTNKFKDLNIKGILPLIKDSNNLGVVSRIIGVDLQTNIDVLIEGFRRGKYSIAQVNAEIAKTQDLLGEGIPGATGAVDQAFKNLIDAGQKGGEFSLDAFGDIFAEYRERFAKEGSVLREQQRKQLLANFDATKEALLQASGPEQIAAAQKAFDDAEAAYNNFIKNVPEPDLAGLREELLRTFAPEEVDKFFRALDESGMSSFEDFEKAGDESVVKILGRLKELGFQFNKTTGDIQGINNGLNQAAKEANGGKDPLDEALRLIREINSASGKLPSAFNKTGEAAGKLNGPLKRIADSIEKTLTQLGKLSGNKFNNDVIFNVKTTGNPGAQALVELLFGPGDLVSDGTGNGSKGKKRTVTKTLPKNEKPKR